jgi:hypothetical protein
VPEHETYVQGGAQFRGKQTKAGLREAVKTTPSNVYLYDTSAFGSKFSGSATELPKSICFNVVGPDPYSRRDWYASVYMGRGGKLVVK